MATKKAKKPKDPNAPKRSQSSYFLFMNERRPIIKNENPDKKMTEISKMISAEWKTIDEEVKKGYQDKAAQLKAKYQVALEEYQKTSEYRQYQKILEEWKEEQNESKNADKGKESNKKVKGGKASPKKNNKKKKPRYQDSDEEEYEQESSGSDEDESSDSGGSGDSGSSASGSDEEEDDD